MTAYHIHTEADRKMVMARLTNLPADGKWKVTITRSEKRRDAQNRLLWRWNTAIAEQMHDSKESIHAQNKLDLGVPILLRDNDDFAETWGVVADALDYAGQLRCIRYMDVTSIMTVKQMAEFLEAMELHYERNGILLPKKDDEYWEALGFTRRAA